MSVESVFVCSTAHIRKETSDRLSAQVGSPSPALVVYPHGLFGWLIYVPPATMDADRVTGMLDGAPTELVGLLWIARWHKCSWLLLDRDGDVYDLPTWDW